MQSFIPMFGFHRQFDAFLPSQENLRDMQNKKESAPKQPDQQREHEGDQYAGP